MVTICIFFEFALLGMYLFGGVVTNYSMVLETNPSLGGFQLMNFNDLLSSLMTLFALLIVNNWYVIVELFVDFKGGNTLYQFYFLLFYYFGVILALNILVAFAIDMYSVVERLDAQRVKNEAILNRVCNGKKRQVAIVDLPVKEDEE